MHVRLTIQDPASPGIFQYVEGDGTDYASAMQAARALVPDGFAVIVIRTSETAEGAAGGD